MKKFIASLLAFAMVFAILPLDLFGVIVKAATDYTVSESGGCIDGAEHKKKALVYNTINSSSYPFGFNDGVYYSTNKGNSSSSTFTIKIVSSGTMKIEYYTSTETNYDYIYIKRNGTNVCSASGITSWNSVELEVNANDRVEIVYSKDGSQSSGNDTVYFKIISGDGSGFVSAEKFEPTCKDAVVCDVCGETVKAALGHLYDTPCDPECDRCGETRSTTHAYDHDCDTECNKCGETRVVPHDYDNDCDAICNYCQATRSIVHKYDDVFDTTCNKCGLERKVETDGYFTYAVENGEAVIIKFESDIGGNVTVPEKLGNYPVRVIGEKAFMECENIDSIVIPEGVRIIDEYAFTFCSLTSITLPSSLKTIKQYAFYNATLGEVFFNGGKELWDWIEIDNSYNGNYSLVNAPKNYGYNGELRYKISGSAVTVTGYFDNITEIVIPSKISGYNVTAIKNYAFKDCASLTSVTIPDSVTTIGEGAFKGCTSLESITLPFIGYSKNSGSGYNGVLGYIFGYVISNNSNESISGATFQYYDYNSYYYYYIPLSLKRVTVTDATSIYERAFYNCSRVTSITIPDSVISIGYSAFYNCSSLTSVHLPDSVESIGNWAFYNCGSLTSVNIPDSVRNIGNGAFSNCSSLTSVNIPDSVKSIGYEAFANCTKLAEVTIGSGVMNIGDEAFYNCSSLTSVNIPDGVNGIGDEAFYNCSRLTSITIPNSVESIGDSAFSYCTKLAEVTMGSSVTSIGDSAFYNCTKISSVYITDMAKWCSISFEYADSNPLYNGGKLYLNGEPVTNLVIPEGVISIANYAFYNCSSITSANIPDSVTSIGRSAFSNCAKLAEVTIGSGVTSIGYSAFFNCTKISSVYITDMAKWCAIIFYDDYDEFSSNPLCYGAKLYLNGEPVTNLVIPEGVTSIGNSAFYNCGSLTSVNIPDSVTSIGYETFYNCSSITSINIPNSVTSIGYSAFYNCTNLSSVYITDIAKWCAIIFSEDYRGFSSNPLYYGAKLYLNGEPVTNLIIPQNVTDIADRAFYGCGSIISITVHNDVESIGYDAFNNCDKLANITVYGAATRIYSNAFSDDTVVYCYKDSNAADFCSQNGYEWVVYLDGTPEETVVSGKVGRYRWTLDKKAGHLELSGSGAIIDFLVINAPWYDYRGYITSISFPQGITKIGANSFIGCINLDSIVVPQGVESIGNMAFSGCGSLLSVELPQSIKTIGNSAFYGCTSLTGISIPDSVTSIGDSAFGGCTGLTSISIPNSVTSIGDSVFSDCAGLTSINIPDSVTSIGYDAFSNCSSLTSIAIPDSVTSIGSYAFSNCYKLAEVTIGSGVESIGSSAFSYCTNLSAVYITDMAKWCGIDFSGYTSNPLYYAKNLYLNGELVTDLIIPDGVETVKYGAFYNCDSITSVTIPNSVKTIESHAFWNCSNLQDIIVYSTDCEFDLYCWFNYNHIVYGFVGSSAEAFSEIIGAEFIDVESVHQHSWSGNCINGVECTVCKKVEGPGFWHNYEDIVVPPTETQRGYTEHICQDCGDSYIDNFVDFKAVVSGVKTTPSDVDVTLSWDPLGSVVEYYAKVYDKDFTTCLKTITTKGTSAVFDYKLLKYNTDYKFIVTARLSSGEYLKVAEAIKVEGRMVVGERVVGLNAAIEGKGAVVTFLPVEKATEYLVNVFANDVNGERIYSATLSKDATSARIMNNLIAGTKYVVVINAKVNGKYMPLSDLRVNGISTTFTAPVVNPTAVTVAAETATSIRFNWDAVRGASQYFIKVTEKESGKLVNTLNIVGKTTATLSRYTDGTRISPNTTYILQFYTYINSTTNSGSYGESIEITTKDYETVTLTAVYDKKSDRINLSWNRTTNAVGYFISTYKDGTKISNQYIDGGDKTTYSINAFEKVGTYTFGIVAYEKNSSGTAYTPISMSDHVLLSVPYASVKAKNGSWVWRSASGNDYSRETIQLYGDNIYIDGVQGSLYDSLPDWLKHEIENGNIEYTFEVYNGKTYWIGAGGGDEIGDISESGETIILANADGDFVIQRTAEDTFKVISAPNQYYVGKVFTFEANSK